LHAGAAVALVIGQRALIAGELRAFDLRRGALVALSLVPPVIAGFRYERQIEARLGEPRAIAGALLAGSAAMVAADRSPQTRGPGDARPADGLALGLAQAAALVPGLSRTGATLTAARWRGFTRDQADLLSRAVAVPVIGGAAALKALRLRRRGVEPELRSAIAVGTVASFASTMASQGLLRLLGADRPLWPYAAYRTALAAVVLVRLNRHR
jgi:undecaprenyl-diphosphatase